MARTIIKLSEGEQSWYLEFSSVVDAPVTDGMSLEEFKEYYRDEYGRSSMEEMEKRLAEVEAKGTSSRMYDSAEAVLRYNRAGVNETQLTIQQIIDHYCKRIGDPPMGTKHE